MAAPYSIILRKCEKAAIAYLTTKELGVPIYCGKASTDKAAPCVVVYAENAKEETDYSGNSKAIVHTMVKYPLAVDTDGVDPVEASDALTASTFDALLPGAAGDDTALAILLTAQAIPDYTAMSSRKIAEEANAEGDAWVETLTLEIYCAPKSGL